MNPSAAPLTSNYERDTLPLGQLKVLDFVRRLCYILRSI